MASANPVPFRVREMTMNAPLSCYSPALPSLKSPDSVSRLPTPVRVLLVEIKNKGSIFHRNTTQ